MTGPEMGRTFTIFRLPERAATVVYLMPLDARDLDLDLDLDDPTVVTRFLLRHIEHTLGGPRDSWASRSTMISARLSVVTPWTTR